MKVCVFCGSNSGANPIYAEAARELGRLLSKQLCTLVYGGGNIGLMGIVADEMIRNSAPVIGVIPDFLVKREVAHAHLTELVIVNTMHDRKRRMADLADLFIVLPGGMGTLDEMAEILTWKQLGLIQKPLGLLNVNHYFDALVKQLETMVQEGFLYEGFFSSIKINSNPQELLTLLGVVPV